MKFNDYLNELIALAKNNPEIGELEVIYSSDDEGNCYDKVNFYPTVVYTEGTDNYYIKVTEEETEFKAVCIN
jgi:hypothetical protein